MAEFSYPPNDPDELDPTDFVSDPWTDPNGSQWLYVASPGYWNPVTASISGGNEWSETGTGSLTTTINGTDYFIPAFTTDPNA